MKYVPCGSALILESPPKEKGNIYVHTSETSQSAVYIPKRATTRSDLK